MQPNQKCTFATLFGGMWKIFTRNYGLCLGIAFLYLLLHMGLFVVDTTLTFAIGQDEIDPLRDNIKFITNFLLYAILIFPISAYLVFWLIQRVRNGDSRRRGRFGNLIVISVLMQLCLTPGIIVMSTANPGQDVEMRMLIKLVGVDIDKEFSKDMLDAAVKKDIEKYGGKLEKDSPNAQERHAILDPLADRYEAFKKKSESLTEKMDSLRAMHSPGLAFLSYVLLLAGFIFVYFWAPWAMIASLDTREDQLTLRQALARGRAIARHTGPFNIWLVPLISGILGAAGLAACILPGIVFTLPLAMACVPSMYMQLRGESLDISDRNPDTALPTSV